MTLVARPIGTSTRWLVADTTSGLFAIVDAPTRREAKRAAQRIFIATLRHKHPV